MQIWFTVDTVTADVRSATIFSYCLMLIAVYVMEALSAVLGSASTRGVASVGECNVKLLPSLTTSACCLRRTVAILKSGENISMPARLCPRDKRETFDYYYNLARFSLKARNRK